MQKIIDVALDVSPFAEELRRKGVETVIRYYNHRNSSRLPTKQLTPAEASALTNAGLSLAVVFQQGGGAQGNISELTAETGARDATQALELASGLRQPKSAIYFAVDHDYIKASDLKSIEAYFRAAKDTLKDQYFVGCYGSGTVTGRMKVLGLIDHIWLSGSIAWSGTKTMLHTDQWSLFQKDLNTAFPGGRFFYDGNVQSPAFPDFGQFTLGSAGGSVADRVTARAIMEVTARTGLEQALVLRAGPGQAFDKLATLPGGTLVEALGRSGEWIEVDLEGDGRKDGYMHSGFLRAVSGGLSNTPADASRPIDVARAELKSNVSEIPGTANNPRIVLYHSTTNGGAAPDEVPWCSSFVNFCVEQAGLRGTDNKWAMSWHDARWGTDVTGTPAEGDIAVFERREGSASGKQMGGHVGFFLSATSDSIRLLGGNQSNRVSIAQYPKAGPHGSNFYRLLSIRRQ